MSAIATPAPQNPSYWTQLALEQLKGLQPGSGATTGEQILWGRLVALQAAANAVLSDVDDDGVAEANDMAVLGLRQAVKGTPKRRTAKGVIATSHGVPRSITAR